MSVKLVAVTVVTSLMLFSCGGGSDSNDKPSNVHDGDNLITVLPKGKTKATTTAQIESILANNDQILEEQSVTFVLPEKNQTLILTSDLTVNGELIIK